MKKLKRIAALTLAAACAATVCAGAAFTDQSDIKVDSRVIDTLVEKNVIKGYENGSFQPFIVLAFHCAPVRPPCAASTPEYTSSIFAASTVVTGASGAKTVLDLPAAMP